MRHSFHALLGPSLVLLLAAPGAGASESAAEIERLRGPFHFGGQEISFHAGYAKGQSWGGGRGEVDDVEMFTARPRWGVGVTDPLGGKNAWYRGNFEVLGEGEFLLNTHPRGGYGAGMTVMARYNWLRDADWIPFFEVGAGILYLGFDLDQQSDGLNFAPQGGVGIHRRLDETLALTLGVRFHHISNAGIEHPNLGINSSLFTVGLSFF